MQKNATLECLAGQLILFFRPLTNIFFKTERIDCIHSINQNGVTIESTAMLEGRAETN